MSFRFAERNSAQQGQYTFEPRNQGDVLDEAGLSPIVVTGIG
jgi:hypothetical protein